MAKLGKIKNCSVCRAPFQSLGPNVCKNCRNHASEVITKNKIRATGYTETTFDNSLQIRVNRRMSWMNIPNDKTKIEQLKRK